jgi:ribonuclease D
MNPRKLRRHSLDCRSFSITVYFHIMSDKPLQASQPQVEIISQPAQLDTLVRDIAESKAIAVDTESNSLHHYPEQLCLIQVATLHKIYIIDMISLREIGSFEKVLRDDSITKVIHGADYDVRCLDRHYGCHIQSLYDTSIAARFAGITNFGLADLIKDLLGETILKSERLQHADWGQRPLSSEAMEYAAADVHHLFALWDILEQRLRDLGRTAWVAEECSRLEQVRYTEPNLETACFSVKGAQNLDGAGLAILKSLLIFRDEEARRQRRPPFFVIPNVALIFLAANPEADMSEVPGLGPIGLQRYGRSLQQALRHGLKEQPISRPPVETISQAQVRRLSRLKAWRESLGVALSLDPSLLWPTTSLERLARVPDSLNVEMTSANIRNWQRDQFGASLNAYIKSLPP